MGLPTHQGRRSVLELAEVLGLSQPSATFGLARLRELGLVGELRDRLLNVIEEQSKTIAALPAATGASADAPTAPPPTKRGFWARLTGKGA